VNPGDLIWQKRKPGGVCIIVSILEVEKRYMPKKDQCIWASADWPILRILHPKEGLIDDPSYYYETLSFV